MTQMVFLSIINLAIVVPFASTLVIHHTKNLKTNSLFNSLTPLIKYKLSHKQKTTTSTTKLFGIHEWRDNAIILPENSDGNSDNLLASKVNDGTIPPREICLLPFAYDEILLQGETKELRLYEERFIKLFQKSMNEHGGIIGMALLVNDSSILKPIPICEIESYNQMSEFGIFCTIRVISRATIIRFVDYTPYITAICVEKMDKNMDLSNKKQVDLLNYLASNIENTVLTLSSLEFQLNKGVAKKEEQDSLVKGSLYGRIDDDDDDDIEDDDDDELIDPVSRFRHAFHQAKESDYNGYTTTIQTTESPTEERSIQDLTALSWAAFSCYNNNYNSNDNNNDNMTYRIQVLDSCRLLDRLYIGIYVLREKKKELEEELALIKKRKQRENDDFL